MSGVSGAQTAHRCKPEVKAALDERGFNLDDVSNVIWRTDVTGHGVDRYVLGHRFYGQPAECSEGEVVVSLWQNCGVQQVYTRGNCSFPKSQPSA